jgi:hypothetical protein
VCHLQVRPLNKKELDEGARNCVQFDDASKQVVMSVSTSRLAPSHNSQRQHNQPVSCGRGHPPSKQQEAAAMNSQPGMFIAAAAVCAQNHKQAGFCTSTGGHSLAQRACCSSTRQHLAQASTVKHLITGNRPATACICITTMPVTRSTPFPHQPSRTPRSSCPSLQAVDKATLVQLRGRTAIGYAFDRRYGPDHTSDSIYDDCVASLVDNLFKVWRGEDPPGGGGGWGAQTTQSVQGRYASSR